MTDLDWRERAACKGVDVDVFYRHELERNTARVHAAALEAMTYCRACPVAKQCLNTALNEPGKQHGIRAGTYGKDRTQMIQRARKDAAS